MKQNEKFLNFILGSIGLDSYNKEKDETDFVYEVHLSDIPIFMWKGPHLLYTRTRHRVKSPGNHLHIGSLHTICLGYIVTSK